MRQLKGRDGQSPCPFVSPWCGCLQGTHFTVNSHVSLKRLRERQINTREAAHRHRLSGQGNAGRRGRGDAGDLPPCWRARRAAAPREAGWRFLIKRNMQLPHDSAAAPFSTSPRKSSLGSHRSPNMTVHGGLFLRSPTRETPEGPPAGRCLNGTSTPRPTIQQGKRMSKKHKTE